MLDHLESNRHGVWGKAEQNGALCPMPSRAHARSCNVREQMERRVGRRWPRQRIAASRHSGLGCMSPAEGVHDHAGVVLQCCLRFDGGILLTVAACARIERTRIECIGQETRRPFRLLFVATQSLHILRNMVHRVVKAAENMLRCRFIGTSPILLPQKRGVAPQKQGALRIWGRRRTLQQRYGHTKKTFGGCASSHNTAAPLSANVTVSAYVF